MRTTLGTLLLALLGFLALPSPSLAQVSRADSAAVLLEAARTFETEGRDEVAVALLQYISERFGDTPAGLRAVALLEEAPEDGAGSGSRTELMVWGALYGSWLGVAIPAALGADDPGPYGAGLLLGGPGGFLAGRALGRSRILSEGQVRAITFGGTWGTWQGFGWTEVLDLGEDEVCGPDYCYPDETDTETVMRGMILGGLAGIATGAVLARRPIPAGVATSANLGGFWGSWIGLAGGILAEQDGDGLLATTLLTGNAGILGGALLGSAWDLSRPRARLISMAGVLGGLAGGGLDLLIQPGSEKVAIGIPLAGSLAGLAAGAVLTTDQKAPAARGGSSAVQGTGRHAPLSGNRISGDLPSADPALLHLRDGALEPGIPAPFLTVLPVETPRGTTWRPGMGLTLFSATF